jgi:hypothetical protein
VLDLDAQLSRAQNCPGSAVVPPAASSDGESTDTDTSDSGSSQTDKFFDDAVLKRWTFVQDAQGLPRVYKKFTGDG